MGLVVVTPPDAAHPVVSIDEAKAHMRVDGNDEDVLIQGLILAVTDWVAGPEGWLGRSLSPQTLELTVHTHWSLFESGLSRSYGHGAWWFDGSLWRVALPRPPLLQVLSVTAIDFDGTETVLPSTGYVVEMGSDGLSYVRSTNVADAFGRLRIRYTAGYQNNAVDEGIRLAMLMTVARAFENREGISDFRGDPLVMQMFGPYRVWSVPQHA